MSREDVVTSCLWLSFVLGGAIWIATRYHTNWYYYDEWSAIARAQGSWTKIFDGHQGHLAFENYIVYRLQRSWFGLEGHELVWAGFIASVAAFQVGVAAVLRRLGLPTLLALLSAFVITFFGPGIQNMVWEFQQNINFALALCFAAGFLALREVKSQRAATAIAVLLVAAVLNDSGLALLGFVYVAALLVLLWPRRHAVRALVPPFVALAAWQVIGNPGPHIGAPIGKMFEFAWRLFLLSTGALVGGGETPSAFGGPPTDPTYPLAGTKVGLLVLIVAGACIVYGARRSRLNKPVIANLIAGISAAVIGVTALAYTRAFLVKPEQFSGSRYVQWIGVFMMLALAPAITAALRPTNLRTSRIAQSVAAVALVAIFVVNLNQMRPASDFYQSWSNGVKEWVRQTVTAIDEGCGGGRRLDLDATAEFSPQVSVAMVRRLLREGALSPEFGAPLSRTINQDPCRRPGTKDQEARRDAPVRSP